MTGNAGSNVGTAEEVKGGDDGASVAAAEEEEEEEEASALAVVESVARGARNKQYGLSEQDCVS